MICLNASIKYWALIIDSLIWGILWWIVHWYQQTVIITDKATYIYSVHFIYFVYKNACLISTVNETHCIISCSACLTPEISAVSFEFFSYMWKCNQIFAWDRNSWAVKLISYRIWLEDFLKVTFDEIRLHCRQVIIETHFAEEFSELLISNWLIDLIIILLW